MKTSFTPGPWTFEKHENSSDWLGNIVGHYGDNYIRTITCQTRYGTEEEQAANATLIAAAPDLLEALKAADKLLNHLFKVVPWGNTAVDVGLLNDTALEMTAAIRKATK